MVLAYVKYAPTVVTEERLYAVGGVQSSGVDHFVMASDQLEMYSPANNMWAGRMPMPSARFLCGVAGVGDALYVVGGDGGDTDVGIALHVYHTYNNSWGEIQNALSRGHAHLTI